MSQLELLGLGAPPPRTGPAVAPATPLALFSPCRTWRYWLRRPLAAEGKLVLWVMLSRYPSS